MGASRPAAGGGPESLLRRAGVQLLVASFLVLFLELALIRWLPTQVHIASYFPNLVLIAAFLGLGLGALRQGRRPLMVLWPVGLVVLVVATTRLGTIAFTANEVGQHLWLLYHDLPDDALVVEGIRLPLVALFVLTAAAFVPLGQYVGERLETFRMRGAPLIGYALDLGGSLLGVVAFSVLSFAGTFPAVWFTSAFVLGGVLFIGQKRRSAVLYAAAAAASLWLILGAERGDRYSPYYSLQVEEVEVSAEQILLTNGSVHQMAMAIQYAGPPSSDTAGRTRHGYHLPYRLLGREPGDVLILGAGTGNDVAVAVEEGAASVDAVEIDPVILQYGKALHPNRPYDDTRVRTFVTDARSYLNNVAGTYDLVVFGTLDSQTQLSALASVRLDNFVYTRESIESAARTLAPGGGMALYFMVGEDDFIAEHIVALLTTVFGEPPTVLRGGWNLFSHIFLAGPAFSRLDGARAGAPPAVDLAALADVPMPTDDWPYLYLRQPGVTSFYGSLMAIIAALAVLAVFLLSRDARTATPGRNRPDLEMFLYGLGFLLVEARLVNAVNLAWGATWLTSAVVFSAVLAAILVVTLVMAYRPIPWGWAATGLLLSLAVTYAVPVRWLVAQSGAARLALSAGYVALPITFAAACFAIRFRVRANSAVAFAWNLLGAVMGGLLEFLAMDIGLRAVVLVAAGAYALTVLLGTREQASASRGAGAGGLAQEPDVAGA